MTTAEWKNFENQLSHAFGTAKLVCDGINVAFQVRKAKGLKYHIFFFVDGVFKSKWLSHEEPHDYMLRFGRQKVSYRTCPKKKREKLCKKFKNDPEMLNIINRKRVSYYCYWSSVKPLIRHLKANNKEIKLVA